MAIYWRFRSVPELEGVPFEEQKAVYRTARRQADEQGALNGPIRVYIVLVLTTYYFVLMGTGYIGGIRPWWLSLICFVSAWTLPPFTARVVLAPWFISRIRPFLRRLLVAGN